MTQTKQTSGRVRIFNRETKTFIKNLSHSNQTPEYGTLRVLNPKNLVFQPSLQRGEKTKHLLFVGDAFSIKSGVATDNKSEPMSDLFSDLPTLMNMEAKYLPTNYDELVIHICQFSQPAGDLYFQLYFKNDNTYLLDLNTTSQEPLMHHISNRQRKLVDALLSHPSLTKAYDCTSAEWYKHP